ncbi:MAG TPA: hypothetical protein VF178_09870 [Gemmatimonadaceae bacterium]
MTAAPSGGYGFGTFKGVFTPSILTILGVVMYLRMGWVLGNVGLATTIVIVTFGSAITFLTALSLSALATNMRVGGGGAYYIISRSLGIEAGAAIGLPLYIAQALGISFYIAGFSEALVGVFPVLNPLAVGLIALILLAALAYRSADLALKTQYPILIAIVASLALFYFGSAPAPLEPAATPTSITPLSFWPVFAVFFPAVTGIEAGLSMSGDLKDPTRSLPRGTILAVLVSYVIYLSIPIVLYAFHVDRQQLLADPLVMGRVSRWEAVFHLGVWASSLSSAMGALLGAPRTLQALAKDGVVPRFLGRGYGPHNDPRFATFVSFAIGATGVMLGDLNAIAPILAMFFLTSYGVLNLSAGLEGVISNPAWRPRFRVPAWMSLAGFAACLIAMLMIAPGVTIIASATCILIYWLMKRRALRAQWGDMRLGFMMFFTRLLLTRMDGHQPDARSWKPNLLVLSGPPSSRWYLIELADAIAQSRSFVTVATFIPEENWTTARVNAVTEAIRSYLRKRDVPAFIRALPASDPYAGAAMMIRSYGFGPITPNTILIGETEHPTHFVQFANLIALVTRSERNLIVVRQAGAGTPADKRARETPRRVDVWWSRRSAHTAFMLALALLLQRSKDWNDAELHFHIIVDNETERAEAAERLEAYLRDARVEATPAIHIRGNATRFAIIRQQSADADLVFLGLRPPAADESAESYAGYYENVLRETETLPATALVIAAEQVDFRRIFESS